MRSSIVALMLWLSACSTPYQGYGLTGGFEETRLAPDAWRVTFTGNGFTATEQVQDFVLLRSAELALKNGYSYFGVVSGGARMNSLGVYTAPTTTFTAASAHAQGNMLYGNATSMSSGGVSAPMGYPTASSVVVMFRIKPEGVGLVYDAQFICRSIGAKYQATCRATG